MRSKDLILGIDGGGTKTVAWLASAGIDGETVVLGRGSSGPSNIQAVGGDSAIQNLNRAIAAAFDETGTAPGTVAAAVLGLAGSDRAENRDTLHRWADDRHLARRFRVVNDALPVIAAGSPEGWGIGLICGTGSFCFGQAADGRSVRAGGWGYLFGDEGSGYAIALAGLRAAAKSADGRGPATKLLPALLRRLSVDEPLQLIPTVYEFATDRAAIADLAAVVTETADHRDPVAEQIVEEAADELSAMVRAVAEKLNMLPAPFPLALSGGVLLATDLLVSRLRQRLQTLGLQPAPVSLVAEPVSGALKLARLEASQ